MLRMPNRRLGNLRPQRRRVTTVMILARTKMTRTKMTRTKMTRTKMKAWRTYSHLQIRLSYQKINEGVKSKKLSRHKVNFQTPWASNQTLNRTSNQTLNRTSNQTLNRTSKQTLNRTSKQNLNRTSSSKLLRQSIVEISLGRTWARWRCCWRNPLGRLQRRTWARWRWCWRNPSAWSCWRNPYCAAYAAAAWRRVRADYRARNSRHTRHGPLSSGTNHPNTLYVLGFDCAKCSVLGEGGCNCINKEVSCCFHVPFFFSFRYPLVPVYKNQRGHENNKTPLYQCSCKRVFFLALTMCRFYLMCY